MYLLPVLVVLPVPPHFPGVALHAQRRGSLQEDWHEEPARDRVGSLDDVRGGEGKTGGKRRSFRVPFRCAPIGQVRTERGLGGRLGLHSAHLGEFPPFYSGAQSGGL